MTISPEAEASAARYFEREQALHEALKPQYDLLFGKFARAICGLEDAVTQRECARYLRRDEFPDDADYLATYEELDAQVQEARRKVVNEAINLATSSVFSGRGSVAP